MFARMAPRPLNLTEVGMTLVVIAAVGWLLGLLLVHVCGPRSKRKGWVYYLGGIALVLAGLLVALADRYSDRLLVYTVPFADHRVVVGVDLTDPGRDYFRRYPTENAEDAVRANSGSADDIWTAASIRPRRRELFWLLCPFTFCVVLTIVLAAYCVADLVPVAGGDRRGS
ncbi:MAG: hypothetical protein ACKVS8_11160 [Phycisphaerales bacterium]